MVELSRRGFLGGLLAVVSAPAIVRVESLMGLPDHGKLLVPETGLVWLARDEDIPRSNNLLTISMITREAVRLFANSNAFIQNIDAQYDNEFSMEDGRIGNTLRIRMPADFADAIARGQLGLLPIPLSELRIQAREATLPIE